MSENFSLNYREVYCMFLKVTLISSALWELSEKSTAFKHPAARPVSYYCIILSRETMFPCLLLPEHIHLISQM